MTEQRRYPRFAFSKELIISATEPTIRRTIDYYAWTINVSVGGTLFYATANFRERTTCECSFKTNRDAQTIHRHGTILRTVGGAERPPGLAAEQQLYALEFKDLLSNDELLLIADLTEGQLLETQA